MQTTTETGSSHGKLEPQILHGWQRTVAWDLGALTRRCKGQHPLRRWFFIHSLILQTDDVVLSAVCRPLTSGLEQQRMNAHALCPHRAVSHFCENCVYVRPSKDLLVISRKVIKSRRGLGFWQSCGWRPSQKETAWLQLQSSCGPTVWENSNC